MAVVPDIDVKVFHLSVVLSSRVGRAKSIG